MKNNTLFKKIFVGAIAIIIAIAGTNILSATSYFIPENTPAAAEETPVVQDTITPEVSPEETTEQIVEEKVETSGENEGIYSEENVIESEANTSDTVTDEDVLSSQDNSDMQQETPMGIAPTNVVVGGTAMPGAIRQVRLSAFRNTTAGEGRYYIYAKAGEKITVSGTVVNILDPTMSVYPQKLEVFDPAGVSKASWTVPSNIAINNNFTLGTTITVPTTGVYQVAVNQPIPSNQYKEIIVDVDFKVESGTIRKTGRVWTENVSARQNKFFDSMDYWFQTVEGYQYRYSAKGFHGIDSAIASDQVGLTKIDGACESIYSSRYSGQGGYGISKSNPECKDKYYGSKIFIEAISTELPETATINGVDTWLRPILRPTSVEKPIYSSTSNSTHAGNFQVEIQNFQGYYELQIDTNNDGVFNGATDVTKKKIYKFGEIQSVQWDGKNASGVIVPPYQKVNARVYVERAGEIHIVARDIEYRTGGVEIQRLNGQETMTGDEAYAIYFNDTTGMKNYINGGTCPPPTHSDNTVIYDSGGGANPGSIGISSKGYTHRWDIGVPCTFKPFPDGYVPLQNSTWGDFADIDEWTYEKINQTSNEEIIQPRIPNMLVNKTVIDASGNSQIEGGENFAYTMTFTNQSNVTAENVRIKDPLTDVLPHIVNGGNPTAITTITVKNGGVVVPTITTVQQLIAGVALDIEPGKTVEITLQLQAKSDLVTSVVNGGALKNTVSAIWSNSGVDVTTTADASIPVGAPNVSVAKDVTTISPGVAKPGEVLTYTLKASNSGTSKAIAVDFKDPMTAVLPYITNTSAPVSVSGGTNFSKTVTTLQDIISGFTVDIEAGTEVVVTIPLTLKSTIDTTLMPDANSNGIPDMTNTATIYKIPVSKTVDVGEEKVVGTKKAVDASGDGKIAQGEKVTYTLLLHNSGTVVAPKVGMKDTLEHVLPYIENGGNPIAITGVTTTGGVNFSKTPTTLKDIIDGFTVDVRPNETVEINFTVTTKATLDVTTVIDIDGDNIKELFNQALLAGGSPSVELPFELPVLTAKKTVKDTLGSDNKIQPGEAIDYAIEVKNTGLATSFNTVVQDTLTEIIPILEPGYGTSSVTIASDSATSGNNGKTFTVQQLIDGSINLTLLSNETVTVGFFLQTKAAFDTITIKTLTNTAVVKNSLEQKNPTATIPTGAPGLVVNKTAQTANGDSVITQGEKITYTLTADNTTGTAPALGVKFQDGLSEVLAIMEENPANVTIAVSGQSGITGSATRVSDLVTGFLVNIPAGNKVTVIFTVTAKPTLDVSTITAKDGNGNPTLTNTATIGTTEKSVQLLFDKPSVAIEKTVVDAYGADGVAQAGETLNYTLTVRNTGNATSQNTVIRDPLTALLPLIPAPTTSDLVTITSNKNATTTAKVTDLMSGAISKTLVAGEVLTLTFGVRVKDTADMSTVVGGKLSNTATVKNSFEEKTASVELTVGTPTLSIEKAVSDSTGDQVVQAGESFTYTLTVKNSGTVTSYGSIIEDSLASIEPYIDAPIIGNKVKTTSTNNPTNTTTTKYSVLDLMGETLTPVTFDILANETLTLSFTVKAKTALDIATVPNGKLTNTATVTTPRGTQEATTDITVGASKLTTSKSATDSNNSGTISQGETVSYMITASNGGTVKDTITIKDTLGDMSTKIVNGTNLSAIPMVVTVDGTVNTSYTTLAQLAAGFTLDLEAGSTVAITFTVQSLQTLDVSALTSLKNTADISSKNEGKTYKPTAEVPYDKPVLVAAKAVTDSLGSDNKAQPGEALLYTLVVENTGHATSYNTVIRDELAALILHLATGYEDAIVTIDSTNNSNDRTYTVRDLITGTITLDVVAGEKVYVTFTVTVNATLDTTTVIGGNITNVASIKNNIEEKKPTVTIPVIRPTLNLTKKVTDSTGDMIVQAGESFTYTLEVKNTGSATSYTTKIQDTLSDIYPYIDAPESATVTLTSATNPSNAGTSYTVSDLMAGSIQLDIIPQETVVVTFNVTAKAALDTTTVASGKLANTATVSTALETKTASKDIPVGASHLTPTKTTIDTGGNGVVNQGETENYTITVVNNGTIQDTITIQDSLATIKANITNGGNLSAIPMEVKVGGIVNPTYTKVSQLATGFTLDVPAGKTVTVTFSVQSLPGLDVSGKIAMDNTATVSSKNENKEYNPTTTIPYAQPVLVATKAVSDTQGSDNKAQPEETLNYSIVVENTGGATSYDTIISDDLAGLIPHLATGYASKTVTLTSANPTNNKTYTVANLLDGTIKLDMLAQEKVTVSFPVTLAKTLDVKTVTALTNTATVKNNIEEKTPTVTIPTVGPAVTATKEATTASGDTTVTQGEKITYTLTADNTTGTATAYNVAIKDSLTQIKKIMAEQPIAVTIAVTGTTAIYGDAATLDDLIQGFTIDVGAGKRARIIFTVTAKADLDVSTIEEEANGSKIATNIATIGEDTPEQTITFGEPRLQLTKIVEDTLGDDGKVQPGETLTYTLDVQNTGTATSYNTVIQDTLTPLLPYIVAPKSTDSVTITSNMVSGSTATVPQLMNGTIKKDIKPGEVLSLTFTVKAKDTLDMTTVAGGVFTNTATATNAFETVEKTADIPVTHPSLTLEKAVTDSTGDQAVQAGESFTYSIKVTNTGEATSYASTIKDTLSAIKPYIDAPTTATKIVSISNNNPANNTATKYSVLDLMGETSTAVAFDIVPSESITLSFTVKAKAALNIATVPNRTLENTATVHTPLETHTATIDIPVGDSTLLPTKTAVDASADGSISQGEAVTYRISIENAGTVKDTITIQDTLATVLPTITGGTTPVTLAMVVTNDGVVDATYTTLAQLIAGFTQNIEPGKTVEVTFTVQSLPDLDVTGKTTLVNTAAITSQNEQKTYKPSATLPYEKPVLVATKTVADTQGSDTKAQPGEDLNYTITVENTGKAISYDTTIQDTLSTLSPYLATGYETNTLTITSTNALNTGTYTVQALQDGSIILDILQGEELQVTFTVTVHADVDTRTITGGLLPNIASIRNKETEVKPKTSIPTATPRLATTKTVTDATSDTLAEPGETLTYTITVDNSGDATSYNTFIQDDLAEILPYINDPALQTLKISTNGVETAQKTVADLIAGFTLDIAADDHIELVFSVETASDLDVETVKDGDGTLGKLHNIATVEKLHPETSIQVGKTEIIAAKQVVDQDGDKLVQPGETFTYMITAENKGTVTGFGVLIQDELTDILPYIDDPSDVVVSVGRNAEAADTTRSVTDLINGFTLDIAAKDMYTISFTVKAKADLDITTVPDRTGNDVGDLANIATVGPHKPEATIEVGAPTIESKKEVTDANNNKVVEAGEFFTYKITATNNGTTPAYAVHVQDTLEDVLPYLSSNIILDETIVTITGGSNHSLGKKITLAEFIDPGFTADLAVNGTMTVTFKVKADEQLDVWTVQDTDADGFGDLTNTAIVGPTRPTAIIPVGEPRIEAVKSVIDSPTAESDNIVTAGEEFEYTITVSNTGLVEAKDVFVQDSVENLLPYIENGDNPNLIPVYVSTPESLGTPYQETTLEALITGFTLNVKPLSSTPIVFKVKAKDTKDWDIETIKHEDGEQDKIFVNTAKVDTEKPTVTIKVRAPKVVPSKTVTEESGDGQLVPGEKFTYTLSEENVGTFITEGPITFKDEMTNILPYVENGTTPENIIVTVTEGNGVERNITGADLIAGITVSPIDAKQIASVSMTLQLLPKVDVNTIKTVDTEGNITLINTAEIDNIPVTAEIDPKAPHMLADKYIEESIEDNRFTRGETFSYVLVTENTGNLVQENVFIQDTMVDVLPYIEKGIATSDIPVTVTDGTTVFTEATTLADVIAGFTISVQAGQRIEITIPLQIASDLDIDAVETTNEYGNKMIRNQAIIGEDTPSVEKEIYAPKIIASKAVQEEKEDGYLQPNEYFTYRITAKNVGTMESKATLIQDELTNILPFITKKDDLSSIIVHVTNGTNLSSNRISAQELVDGFTVDIAVDEEVIVEFSLIVASDLDITQVPTDSNGTPIFHNQAIVERQKPEATIPVGTPNITANKSVTDESKDGYVQPGEHITYTISAANTGTVTAYDVFIQDALETVMPYITYEEGKTNIELRIQGGVNIHPQEVKQVKNLQEGFTVDIPAGEKIEVSFTVQVHPNLDLNELRDLDGDGIKDLLNKAIVGKEQPSVDIPVITSEVVGNKKATDATNDGIASNGEAITYTIEAQNIGDAVAESVTIQDTMLGVLPYIEQGTNPETTSISIDGGSNISTQERNLQTLIAGFTLDIQPKEIVKVTFTVTIRKDLDINTITNRNAEGQLVILNTALVGEDKPKVEIPVLVPGINLPVTGEQIPTLIVAGMIILTTGILVIVLVKRKKVNR